MKSTMRRVAWLLALMLCVSALSLAEEPQAETLPFTAESMSEQVEAAENTEPELAEQVDGELPATPAEDATDTAEDETDGADIDTTDTAPVEVEALTDQPEETATTEADAIPADTDEDMDGAAVAELAAEEAADEVAEETPATSADAETEAAEEVPPVPFAQRVWLGETLVSVNAPAGVFAPDSQLTVVEAASGDFTQAVMAASQVQGDIIRHRMIRFSGAEMNGAAQVKISEPLITALAEEYPDADIQVLVYAYAPDAARLEEQARRVGAYVEDVVVSFQLTEWTIYDVMVVVRLPEAEPAEAPETEEMAESAEAPVPEEPVEALTVRLAATYEGELRYGTTVTLTAIFSAEVSHAVIIWQYSPDGGVTVNEVPDAHGDTLTYTYSEENRDYCWRVLVREE